jgi:glycosyltransferase involved in cell wall biosynthesis
LGFIVRTGSSAANDAWTAQAGIKRSVRQNRRVRIVRANIVYDAAAKTPGELLDRYRTLTAWSSAVAAAGATVSVVQRFRTAGRLERDGIPYQFVADTQPPWLSTKGAPEEFIKAIALQSPDVVHVNGLIFPQLIAGIRAAVGSNVVIVAQHHGGEFPIRGSGIVGLWQRRRWRNGLAAADAISFTTAEQANQWRAAGVLANQRILAIVEASTTMRVVNRERARIAIGASGDPLILWVGRQTSNEDPMTILKGLEIALPRLPGTQVMMVVGDDTLLEGVEQRIRESQLLQPAVMVSGRISHDEMPNYYSAADVFVSASHSEGSSDALIEAMAVGAVPVVSDIPSFRAIIGDCGAHFPAADAGAFAAALVRTCSTDLAASKVATKVRFDRWLTWSTVGARTVAEYQALVDAGRQEPAAKR